MAGERSEVEVDEAAEILRWHAVTHSDHYAETINLLAETKLLASLAACADPKLDEKSRFVEMGRAQVWAEIKNLRPTYAAAFEDMKRAQAEAAHASTEEDLVGPELQEQWYEKRP